MTGKTVLVTGAGGFIGRMCVDDMAAQPELRIDGRAETVSRILAADISEAALKELAARHDKVEALPGDLSDRAVRDCIASAAPDVVVHLAAVVSSAAEADFDLGLDVNLRVLIDLVSLLSKQSEPPVFVFTSSVAVFSCDGNADIDETVEPRPLSSYGAQKVMGEILVRDASRRGALRGRTIRFPTISVRPGKPNKAASSFASGIVREPLAGETALLPVRRDLRLHLASPSNSTAALRHAIGLRQEDLDGDTTITLPGLTVSVAEMIAALGRVAGPEAQSRIVEECDPAIEAIVTTWPGRVDAPRARRLGFAPDDSFESLLHEHEARMRESQP